MAATTEPRRPTRPGRPSARGTVIVVLLLAGAAWAVLAWRHGLPELGGCASHHGGHAPAAPCTSAAAPGPPNAPPSAAAGHAGHLPVESGAPGVVVGLAGWAVMVVAMMLPPALPLLLVVRRLAARAPRPAFVVGAAGLAFLGVWVASGAVLVAADALVTIVDPPVLRERPGAVAGAAALAAGVYQFTPLKRACLTACRSPYGLAATTWTGLRPPALSAATLGARFGLVCVGCCWALMLLTLAVGVAALPVMVAASVLMALERLVPDVRMYVPLLGAIAVVVGLLLLFGLLPAGLPLMKGPHS